MKLFLVLVILNLIFIPCLVRRKEEHADNRYLSWFFKKLFSFLHFSLYYRLGLIAFLWVVLHCVSEIMADPFNSTSYGLTWGLFGAQVLFVWLPPMYALCRRRDYRFIEDGRFRPVYEGMKRRGILTNSHLFYFTFKRLLFAVLCASLQRQDSNWARILPFFLLQIPCCIWMLILRPHKSLLHNVILVANEAFLFVMAFLFFVAVDRSTWVPGYEWFVIAVFLIYTTALSVVAIVEFVRDIV